MLNEELLKAHLLALLPEGSAWSLQTGGDFDLLVDGLAENWTDVGTFLHALAYVRDSRKTPFLEDLEYDLGFLSNFDLTEDARREQLAAFQYADADGVSSSADLQEILNDAGFVVEVHDNDPAVDPALFPGDILLNGEILAFLPAYIAQCGTNFGICGTQDAVCGRFDTFEKTPQEYNLPSNPITWPIICFVGGAATRDPGTNALTSIATANVPLERKDQFIEFILKVKPWFGWAIVIVNYI